ncbi:acyl carrier protein [Streptomyces sp. NBC_00353]|uniref:acyl carrier protein n=1 Tax=Streptomyces sp. NBC_00353 TaxID=2975722 RepID=UPI002E265F14
MRDAWAQTRGIAPGELSTEADFFTDLGGHSLLAARRVVAAWPGRRGRSHPA